MAIHIKTYIVVGILLSGALLTSWQRPSADPYPLVFPAGFGARFEIPPDNPTTKEGVLLVRMLFYEKRLSLTNNISCASCHKQELAFADNKALSAGIYARKSRRNSMSLANILWVRQFFWDGRAKGLEAQAVFPLTNLTEMGQPLDISVAKLKRIPIYNDLFKKAFGTSVTQEGILKALAQFERTLISSSARYDKYLTGTYEPTPTELNGMKLFNTQADPDKGIRGAGCEHCHGGAKMFKELFHNNGLDARFSDRGRFAVTKDTADLGRFRVVTLRNIALTAPYMHDGRFKTLKQVLDQYSDHVKESNTKSTFLGAPNRKHSMQLELTEEEKTDIIAFLNMLTDSTFITNPNFSNPHK